MEIKNEKNEEQVATTEGSKKTDLLWKIFAVVFVVVIGAWFVLDGTEHIEDTNGASDCSIATITDEQIMNRSIGSIGGFNIESLSISGDNSKVSSSINFSSKKFTGVTEILYDNYIGKSDFYLEIFDYKVESGNFELVVVRNDEEIVATLEPDKDGNISYRLDDVKGYYSLRAVGESAAFSFKMTEPDYDYHTHDELP